MTCDDGFSPVHDVVLPVNAVLRTVAKRHLPVSTTEQCHTSLTNKRIYLLVDYV